MREHDAPNGERGQILVIFTLAIVAIMALVGLVLDTGSAYVQRRDMQNAADAAAMAAGYAYANTGSTYLAFMAAQPVAAKNGFATINVTPSAGPSGSTTFSVDISAPHPNTFSGVVGQSSWTVAVTATAITGAPNGASGFMPLIFNQDVLNNGFGPPNEVTFDEPGSGSQDVPLGNTQFNWTVFCLANGNPCNGDSNLVDDMINGVAPLDDSTVTLGEKIGPLNAGAHTTLFSDLAKLLSDPEEIEFPVAIVDNDGRLVAVATFHLTASVGGSTKQIHGYFVGGANKEDMFIKGTAPSGSSQWGSYVVKLTN